MMLEEFELTSLMSRPDLPRIAATINATLEAERQRRQRFRADLTPSVKAEFIAGQMVMHSPAKAKHLRVTDNLVSLLRHYVIANQSGEVFTEKALICLTRNDYEPDVCFFNAEKAATFDGDTMEFPAPDFIVEVLSDSTAHRDRGVKFDDYALHGVKEYWIIDCDAESVEQYILPNGRTNYDLAHKLTEGPIESIVVSGFRIPVIALFDTQENQQALRSILEA
ncbi:Uma2 family endonuclease [Neorhodopirellula pilleata]|nr:Uma2 family endonuclease [Neorhodopirellula pilleata]